MKLPPQARCENFCSHVVIDMETARKRLRPAKLGPPKVVQILEQAERFQRLLDGGSVQRRAELAKRFGISRARVTQILHLLRLHPLILEYVRQLPHRTGAHAVSDRKLRAIAKLESVRQLDSANALPGFTAFLKSAAPKAAGGKG